MARICVGRITGPHGVRGLVRIQSFTAEPEAIATYGPLQDEKGEQLFALTLLSATKGLFIGRIKGVSDRDAAEALAGTLLFARRDALPPAIEEDEYYQADLIGLKVETSAGEMLGVVRQVNDFGAGDVLEIMLSEGGTLDLPFTRTVVPIVDIPGGRLVVEPPEPV